MRVATCTPVNFEGGPRFFSRDTGLLCRGFQAIGHDCMVIMPGIWKEEDGEDLLRCTHAELEDPEWWKSKNLDLVVLYAWVKPRHLPIAKAIRQAGIVLTQSIDTFGLHSPYSDFKDWFKCELMFCSMPQSPSNRLRGIARYFRDFLPFIFEKKRLEMMAESDSISVVSPPAYGAITKYARALGSPDVADKTVVIPHPVSDEMDYDGRPKEKNLMVVGRWGAADSTQKDPDFHLQIIRQFLTTHPDWSADFIGNSAKLLASKLEDWEPEIAARIHLIDFVQHDLLREKYASASIMLCASRFESYHIASAEAVCSGCSVVVPNHPSLASTCWFATHQSGTIAERRDTPSILAALNTEVSAWDSGERQPSEISNFWKEKLLSTRVASMLIEHNFPAEKPA